MNKDIQPRKDSMSVNGFGGRWTPGLSYDNGEVLTPHGIVSVYMQGDNDSFHLTRMDFVVDGRLHIWSYDKRYSRRGVVTKAKQMAKELSQ